MPFQGIPPVSIAFYGAPLGLAQGVATSQYIGSRYCILIHYAFFSTFFNDVFLTFDSYKPGVANPAPLKSIILQCLQRQKNCSIHRLSLRLLVVFQHALLHQCFEFSFHLKSLPRNLHSRSIRLSSYHPKSPTSRRQFNGSYSVKDLDKKPYITRRHSVKPCCEQASRKPCHLEQAPSKALRYAQASSQALLRAGKQPKPCLATSSRHPESPTSRRQFNGSYSVKDLDKKPYITRRHLVKPCFHYSRHSAKPYVTRRHSVKPCFHYSRHLVTKALPPHARRHLIK